MKLKLTMIDRFLAFVIIFINGWYYALPITHIPMPLWLTPVQPVHGVYIHELLIMFYSGFLAISHGGRLPLRHHGAINMTLFILGMGYLGLLSNVVNLLPLKEFGEAGRFFLLALYFSLLVYWARLYGPTFVLRTLLLGILFSGALNIYLAFTVRWMEIGGLPFLLGQNGPGGPLGLSVVLSSWLMLERETSADTAVSLASLAVGVLGASMSYSKISMLIAACGLLVWGVVVLVNLSARRTRRLSIVFLLAFALILFIKHGQVMQYVHGVGGFIERKFIDMTLEDNSIVCRFQYFVITGEIMLGNPLFGVGYGGFYKAAVSTRGFQSERRNIEDSEEGDLGYSNPHNSFLYYASANGVPGLVLAVIIYMKVLLLFRRALSGRGFTGNILWMCLAGGYFIYGMTLPTLFNSSIMYLPAAVAVVFWRQSLPIPSPVHPDSPASESMPVAAGKIFSKP